MDLAFKILRRPVEAELSHEQRTKPMLMFLFLAVSSILLPINFANFSTYAKFIFVLIPIFFLIAVKIFFRDNSFVTEQDTDKIIRENIVGEIVFSDNPLTIKITHKNEIIKNFKGIVYLKYAGYYEEVEGSTKNAPIYYGTKNEIILEENNKKRKFYIFLEDENGKNTFDNLAVLLTQHKLEVKEFYRGERVYLGKKLNYKEIQEFKKKHNPNNSV